MHFFGVSGPYEVLLEQPRGSGDSDDFGEGWIALGRIPGTGYVQPV